MIGYWHHDVVRLSVCPPVTLCIVALGVAAQAKSCTSVFTAGNILFTFAVECIV